MRQTNVRGTLSLRGFRKLRTGAIVATGVILLGLGFLAPTVSANEQDGVWVARTVTEVKADIQNIDNLSHYTIKWGDTLSAISGATGLSVDSLVEINRIANRDLIFANNKLYFSEESFLKDGNTEVKRQRVSIDNSGSCQSYEVETKTDTVTGEQTTTVKQTTPVVVETPAAVAAPKSETSVSVAPKADEPATPAPKVEEPAATTPKAEEPAATGPKTDEPAATTPKAEEPAGTEPKTEEPAATTPKAEEPVTPAPKAEEPAATDPKSDEPVATDPAVSAAKAEESVLPASKSETSVTVAPKAEEPAAGTTPKAENPAPSVPELKAETPATPESKAEVPSTQPSDPTPAPVTPGETSTPAQAAGEVDKAETKVEASNPSSGVTNEDDSGASTPVIETTPSNAETTNQPVASNPSSEVPVPKAEEPTATTPKAEEPAAPAPKVEEPATPAPKADDPVASAPKAEEPTIPAPKAEESATPAPKVEEPAIPAPKVEEPATPARKVEEPVSPALKDDESGSSVESSSTGNHSDESGAPFTTPTGDSTAPKPSDSTSSPVASGESNSTTQPSGETGNSETTAEPSNTPSADATNDLGNAATSSPVTDDTTSNTGTTEQPETSAPKTEATAPKEDKLPTNQNGDTSNPVDSKDETPNPVPAPKEDTPSEEVAPKDEKLEEAKKDGKDVIEKIAASKLREIEKVKDEAEKAKLEAKLKELKEAGLEAIKNAENHDAAVDATDEYQTKIDEIDVPGEELPAPNYNKDNLTNGRNEGTTIDNGSTSIGHGSGEAPTHPASTETTAGTSSFRNAPSVQARARRVARSTSEPDGTVNISYNFAGMPDIHGFLSDPGEDNTVTIPAGTSETQAKELVKEKIQAKIKDLATRGYHVKNDIIFEQDTTVKNYNYVVTFTKEATGTSGFRMAPAVQPRASRNRRSLEQPAPQKVKVNVFYNFDQMKDIAGFLGDINGTPLEVAEGLSNEQVKAAVKDQVDAKKEELSKRGYTFKGDYVYQANGKDYNYVVTFSKAAK